MITVLNQKEIDIISGGVYLPIDITIPIIMAIVEIGITIARYYLENRQNGGGGTPV